MERFGGETGIWETSGAFSAYRQLFENQCDVGSLIARPVFDDGIFFDEGMREGYEDWEFFTRAARAGLRGVPAGRCGFRYRDRGRRCCAARASGTRRSTPSSVPGTPRRSLARRLTQLEHDDLPRFALVSSDRGEVLLTPAPASRRASSPPRPSPPPWSPATPRR